jgi:hypothetical protein
MIEGKMVRKAGVFAASVELLLLSLPFVKDRVSSGADYLVLGLLISAP